MKRYLIVLARGIDGCGVTKNSIEFTQFINSKSDQRIANCISHSDKNWIGRCFQHDTSEIDDFDFIAENEKLKNYVDNTDVVIFNCVPIKKQSIEAKHMFMDLLKYAKAQNKLTVFFNLDRKKRFLKTNMYDEPEYNDLFSYIDIIFNDSRDNDFYKYILIENKMKFNEMICRNENGIHSLFGIDFEANRKKFWKPFEEKENKTLKFIGRSCKIKGAWLVRDLHRDYLRKEGYITTIEGIDMSIGTLTELLSCWTGGKANRKAREDVNLDYIKPTKKNIKFINEGNCVFERDKPAYMMPNYAHDFGLDRLSRCQFGVELFNAKDYLCKDAVENAMFEIVAVGNVPLYREFWAENFILDGKHLIDYGTENTGMIFVDEKNAGESVKLMNELSQNKEKYDEYREKAYNFFKKYFDINSVYGKILDILESK